MTPEYVLFQLLHCAASQLMLRKDSRPPSHVPLFSLADFLGIKVWVFGGLFFLFLKESSLVLSPCFWEFITSIQTETHL